MKQSRKARALRRSIQAASLALFLFLLFPATWPLTGLWLPHDLYLRLDPLVALLVPVAARAWIGPLGYGLAVIALAIVFGRVFCGYICPMGITLDIARWVSSLFLGTAEKSVLSPRWRLAKYAVLTVMATAAVLGVNLLFWGSPLALATRFYALLVHPLLLLAGAASLDLGQPVFASLGTDSLAYASVTPRRFETIYFVLGFFCLLFFLERIRPRFWCRYLCPAGAVLALLSRRPSWRRKVSECTGCGRCVRECPTGAISPGGLRTAHAECIACRTCVDVCPVRGVHFSCRGPEVPEKPELPAAEQRCPLPSRRAFLGAVGTGVILTGVQYSGKSSFLVKGTTGNPWSETLVRPPGALPEPDFLDRCIRCGECMKVCPTNTLQPAWFESGVEGVFSPVIVPRRGPCEPDCTACGVVCPTEALRRLSLKEKHHAKVGTAVVVQHRCLAWAEGKRCMVCQEVCPFGSVRIVPKDGQAVPVPVVDPARCFGCGYCEYHCPTAAPSIRVEPLNALRLAAGGYEDTARSLGYVLEPGFHGSVPEESFPGGSPDGFDDGPPPGFSP